MSFGVAINKVSATANGTGCTINLDVRAGDLIIAGVCAFWPSGFDFGTGLWSYVCSDNDTNVYETKTCATPGFGHVSYSWAIAKSTRTIIINYNESSVQWHTIIASNYRWPDGAAPPLSEWACQITPTGTYPYPLVAPYTAGVLTNYVSFADSTVITLGGAVGSFSTVDIQSDTGDTRELSAGYSPAQTLALFTRNATGPGSGNVALRNDLGVPSQSPIVVGVFSRPRTRPDGLLAQYQIRPGAGFKDQPGNESIPDGILWMNEINRPINGTLAYLPALDSLLCVGVTQSSHVVTPTVFDDYGNTYTLRANSQITGSYNQCVVALYTTIVKFLPPAGEAFIVRASLPGPYTGVIYQPTSINIAEKVITGKVITNFQGAVYDSMVSNVFFTGTIASVPIGAYLFSVAANASLADGSVVWTAQAGFTKRAESTFIQITGQQTNAVRCGPSVICDLVTVGAGSYSAQIKDDPSIGGNPSGGIALLAITLEDTPVPPPAILPCPQVTEPTTIDPTISAVTCQTIEV